MNGNRRKHYLCFLSNDIPWKTRCELAVDYHYRIRVGFCHTRDRHCSLVLLSLPASKKWYVFFFQSYTVAGVVQQCSQLESSYALTYLKKTIIFDRY